MTFKLDRYLGTWYEIASIPTPFQNSCVQSIAHYSRSSDGSIHVVNECYDGERLISSVQGYASPLDPDKPGELIVRFPGREYNTRGYREPQVNYIVHATDYRTFSLVGSPDRMYLWVLSRRPRLSDGIYQNLMNEAAARGYDISRVRKSAHIQ